MKLGRFCITSLDQANKPCSTVQGLGGHLSLIRQGRSNTLLDQQSLSEASTEGSNKPNVINWPSFPQQGISLI